MSKEKEPKNEQAASSDVETIVMCLEEHGKKLDKIIELLEEKNKMSKTVEIRDMKASDFADKNGLNNRICNAILSDEYYRGEVWTVGEVYANGYRLRNFGKKSLEKFREKVDEVENT